MAPHGRCCGGDHHHNIQNNPDLGIEYSLYTKIDKENLECLNETAEGSGKTIFKPWEERLDLSKYVESDADEELIFNIPFTGNIKLKGIVVVGDDTDSHPSKLRVFKNRPSMTFDDVGVLADQEFDLHIDTAGTIEYSTKVVTFNSVNYLTLHFPSNFGSDTTRIYYIGLRGEYSEAHRHGVTICNYELRPNMSDHKNPLEDNIGHQIQ